MASFQSNQNLGDEQRIRQAFPGITNDAVIDYLAKTREIVIILNQIAPQFGSGSPEGVVTSTLSQKYIDTVANTEYYNPDFGVNTGWVAL